MDIGLLKGIKSNIDYSYKCLLRFMNENDDDLEDKESLLEGMNILCATNEIIKYMIPKENEWEKPY